MSTSEPPKAFTPASLTQALNAMVSQFGRDIELTFRIYDPNGAGEYEVPITKIEFNFNDGNPTVTLQ